MSYCLLLFGNQFQGFRKIDPDRWEFANEGFIRGQKHLLKTINRRKTSHPHSSQQQAQGPNPQSGVYVEVGQFGLEEEIDRLKRDKNALMQELVRLRQQQQSTDNQLLGVGQRLQTMEQRQQKMMTFLAKAVNSPGFLTQFVQQQQNESDQQLSGGQKRRRLHRQEEKSSRNGPNKVNSPDGRMVKFQPSTSDAANLAVRDFCKMNSASPSHHQHEALQADKVRSSNPVDTGRFSEMIPEAPRIPVKTFVHADYGFPTVAPQVAASYVNPAQSAAANLPSSLVENVIPGFIPPPESQPLRSETLQGVYRGDSGISSGEYVNIAAALDRTTDLEAGSFFPNGGGDILSEEASKLPGINESFWEEFFAGGESEETDSVSGDGGFVDDQSLLMESNESAWDHALHMDFLTDGMVNLSSQCGRV